MSDSRFSGGQPTGDDRFGYFGAPASGGGGSSQFGGAAPSQTAIGAPNPFGTAPGGSPQPGTAGPQAPFGSGVDMYAPPPPTSSGSKAKPIAIVVIVVAVLGAAWFGYHAYLRSKPVTLPASVAGLPASTDPTVAQAVDAAQKQLQDDNPGMQLAVTAYGDATSRIVIAAAGRGRTNVDGDFAAFGNNIGGTSQVGANTCATSTTSHVSVCERTDGDLTVMVAEVAKSTVPTQAEVSGMVDEIWAQL